MPRIAAFLPPSHPAIELERRGGLAHVFLSGNHVDVEGWIPTSAIEKPTSEGLLAILGAFGGYERGWLEVGPRLDWAAAQYHDQEGIAAEELAGAADAVADRERALFHLDAQG